MKLRSCLFIAFLLAFSSQICFSQTKPKLVLPPAAQSAKSSPAYAEVLLRKTELSAELESLLVEYTDEFPKVKELRTETGLLQKEIDRLLAVGGAEASRLSAALGRLMVRKCEIGTDLWSLQLQFNDQHPDVKRARRRMETFEGAINDILQAK